MSYRVRLKYQEKIPLKKIKRRIKKAVRKSLGVSLAIFTGLQVVTRDNFRTSQMLEFFAYSVFLVLE